MSGRQECDVVVMVDHFVRMTKVCVHDIHNIFIFVVMAVVLGVFEIGVMSGHYLRKISDIM